MGTTRRHHRYAYDGLLSYRRLGSSTPGQVRNISEGGLMVVLPEPLPPGTPLNLDLTLGEESIHAEVEVVWSINSSNGAYPHGCKFTQLKLEGRMTLAVFIGKMNGG